MPWADHRLDQSRGGGAGLKLISKIPEGEVCNYLGIMDTLGGPANFRPHLDARPAENVGRRIYRSCRQRRRINYDFFFYGAPLAFWPITIVRYEFEMHETLAIVKYPTLRSRNRILVSFLLVESLGRVYNFGFIN